MKLILGGYANGRTAYAMQNYQLTESDCFDAAAEPRPVERAAADPACGQLVNPWLERERNRVRKFCHGWNGGRMQCSSPGSRLRSGTCQPQQRRRGSCGTFQQLWQNLRRLWSVSAAAWECD
ncbi:MAG: hypothetical protein ACLR5S_06405 [Ruminococcus sp.]